jgi:ATP-dependent Lon protease
MLFNRKTDQPPKQPLKQDLTELRQEIEKKKWDETAAMHVARELDRLEKTDPSNPDYAIAFNYIEYLLSLPWNRFTDDSLDMSRAEQILESSHSGLKQVKERVLEYLAVLTLCGLKSMNILVVDDEKISRDNMEYVLKKEGYEVSAAANGLEALKQVRKQEIDLIFTDLKMEKMDGLQLLEAVKKISPQTEVVMITGFATVNSAIDALKKGAAHYIAKPIDLDELRSCAKGIQEKKKTMRMTRSPVLCFSGPPGTGKTSVGQAIASALERKFIRMSVAGLRDEAELRGHRRTYVGAMPGRIISEIRRIGVANPVFMIDEIDKIGQDFRGDAASVFLEILDPEQNSRFTDHYLEIPFDLSGVIFIATANVIEQLPPALLDRLEVIRFSGYTEKEKMEIARRYLIPRQLKAHGFSGWLPEFSDSSLAAIIQFHTREAGLRNLEREIAAICRKLARFHLQQPENREPMVVDQEAVVRLLGPPRYVHEIAETQPRLGVVTGLVWTEVGGEIVFVEASLMKGSRQIILTGSLGSVLRESAQTALSYARGNAEALGIDPDFLSGQDIHIHIPAGAIPKDGPSAGVTIAVALISLLTRRPVRPDVAITGELTLMGRLLPVSGIREKILAAQRAGVRRVILPKRNEADLKVIEMEAREGVETILAEDVASVLDRMLLSVL